MTLRFLATTLVSFFLLITPLVSLGQITNPGGTGPSNPGGTGPTNPIGSVTLRNPLGSITLIQFFERIIDILILIAIPIIVFFIILAGFKYVTARGNETTIKDAHRSLTWAVIGGVIILGARAILFIIENTVNALRMP